MTVIIYDGETIAVDSRLVNKSVIVTDKCDKLQEWEGGWFAASGSHGADPYIKLYLETGERSKQKLKWEALYTRDGKGYYLNQDWTEYEAPIPYGLGDGGSDAEVLVRVGYTAEEAASTVCDWLTSCGGDIQSVAV